VGGGSAEATPGAPSWRGAPGALGLAEGSKASPWRPVEAVCGGSAAITGPGMFDGGA